MQLCAVIKASAESGNIRPAGWEFVPLQLGRSDLQGHVQVLQGLAAGDQVVLYSEKVLSAGTRIDITDQLTGQQP